MKKRRFNKHAKAWEFKLYKNMELGERIQIDHMSVSKNGINVKHFSCADLRFRPGNVDQNTSTPQYIVTPNPLQLSVSCLNMFKKCPLRLSQFKWMAALNSWLSLRILAKN